MCAPSELQFGALREGGGTREEGSTVAESLVVLYRAGTHQIRRRRRVARSSTSQGRAEPLCARAEGVNRDVSEGKAYVLTTGIFLTTRATTRSGERARFVGLFLGCKGLGRLDAGSRAGFTSSRHPPSWTSVFQFSLFWYDVWP